MKRNLTIDIDKILSSHIDSPLKDDLNLSLQSFAKRCDYSRLHYHELQKYIGDDKLLMERSGLQFTEKGDLFPHRRYYEAHAIAFTQNLHAAYDSVPLMITLLLRQPRFNGKDFPVKKIGWNQITLDYLKSSSPHQKKLITNFIRLSSNHDFLVLKGLVNQAKHKFLVRILNDNKNLHFEKIRYHPQPWAGASVHQKGLHLDDSGMATVENLNVADFMKRCHNNLLPRLYLLIARAQQSNTQI